MFYQGLESFTVCFFGHRYIDRFAFAETKVEALLSSLFTNGKYLELLVGRNGDFDQIVSSSICRAKKRYGDTNCSHVWVAPYSTAELSNNQKEFYEYYDEIEVASDRLGKLHPKAAFQARNRMMVDSGHIEGNDMILERIVDSKVESCAYPIAPENESIWKSPDVQSIGLIIRFPDETGNFMLVPLSQMSKLSIGNRTKLTFSGDWSMPVNKIALARMYEDLMQKEIKKESVQIITVYGMVHAIMTQVYSPIGHDEFFEKIDVKVGERFGSNVALRSGYISHKWSRATWYIGEYQTGSSSRKVELGISAIDSQTGHSGAVLQPCLFSGRKKHAMLFDDAWYSKHMALTEEGIGQAIDVVHMTLNDNAQKLLDTVGITLQNPGLYAKRICEELNKIAKKMSGALIPGKTVKTFISSVEGLSLIRSNLTVWDVIEILWDLPETTSAGEGHKDGLMKTVSRVITLNHGELDAA